MMYVVCAGRTDRKVKVKINQLVDLHEYLFIFLLLVVLHFEYSEFDEQFIPLLVVLQLLRLRRLIVAQQFELPEGHDEQTVRRMDNSEGLGV